MTRINLVQENVSSLRRADDGGGHEPLQLSEIETVVSHPQANAQCARFIRARLPNARVLAGSSTAEAVRVVAEHNGPWAALGNRLAAERYGCQVLRAGVEDVPDNETRFVAIEVGDVSRTSHDERVLAAKLESTYASVSYDAP